MTDSTSYECPVEGCDFGEAEDKTLAQVRGHVNSNGDEDHVWQDVKHELLAEAEKREATQATDDEDDEESIDMATQEEYEEQYSDEDSDLPEGDEGDGDTESADGDEDDQDGGGFSVPSVSASTVVLVAGVAVAALLIWKLYSGGDAASDYEAPEESADTDDSDDGGMVAVEAGTGGVDV